MAARNIAKKKLKLEDKLLRTRSYEFRRLSTAYLVEATPEGGQEVGNLLTTPLLTTNNEEASLVFHGNR